MFTKHLYCTRLYMYVSHLSLTKSYEIGISTLEVRKLKFREANADSVT